jgi:hypothetical protein
MAEHRKNPIRWLLFILVTAFGLWTFFGTHQDIHQDVSSSTPFQGSQSSSHLGSLVLPQQALQNIPKETLERRPSSYNSSGKPTRSNSVFKTEQDFKVSGSTWEQNGLAWTVSSRLFALPKTLPALPKTSLKTQRGNYNVFEISSGDNIPSEAFPVALSAHGKVGILTGLIAVQVNPEADPHSLESDALVLEYQRGTSGWVFYRSRNVKEIPEALQQIRNHPSVSFAEADIITYSLKVN